VIKNNRYFGAGYVFLEAAGLGNDDIVYVSLPICKFNQLIIIIDLIYIFN
jgi:hypothetical protein